MNEHELHHCLTNKILSLTLMPTEQCNFRCTYCYEDFSIGRMSKSVIQGIKNLLSIRMPELEHLHIEWFGGEPLSARDIIYDISDHILNEIYDKNIHYASGMTTNGFRLTENVFQKLLSCGVRSYQISLDGPEHIHDKTRKRINGSGSFSVIWNNLLAMRKIKEHFNITFRIHVTPENYPYLHELCALIKEFFSDDKRFNIFFKCIENLGGENGGTFKVLQGKEKEEILIELKKLAGIRQNILSDVTSKNYICYASKPNHLVIRADGTIAKCTVAFSDTRNNVGRIDETGKLVMDHKKMSLWTRGLQTKNQTALYCPAIDLPKLST